MVSIVPNFTQLASSFDFWVAIAGRQYQADCGSILAIHLDVITALQTRHGRAATRLLRSCACAIFVRGEIALRCGGFGRATRLTKRPDLLSIMTVAV